MALLQGCSDVSDKEEAAALKRDGDRERDAPSTTRGISLSSATHLSFQAGRSAVFQLVETHLRGNDRGRDSPANEFSTTGTQRSRGARSGRRRGTLRRLCNEACEPFSPLSPASAWADIDANKYRLAGWRGPRGPGASRLCTKVEHAPWIVLPYVRSPSQSAARRPPLTCRTAADVRPGRLGPRTPARSKARGARGRAAARMAP